MAVRLRSMSLDGSMRYTDAARVYNTEANLALNCLQAGKCRIKKMVRTYLSLYSILFYLETC